MNEKKKILELDDKYIWHPYSQKKNEADPLIVVSGEDDKIFDIDGNQYYDLISSWWVTTHGHCNKKISAAIKNQLKKLEQIIFSGFTHAPAVKLAELLTSKLPKDISRVFYSDNGSTSVEIALKVAYQYWYNQGEKQRKKFLAIEGGYHGDTLGAMSVGFSSGFYKPFTDMVIKNEFFPCPFTWEGDNEIFEKEKNSLEAIDLILDQVENEVAAVIIEPLVLGASGMKIYRADYLDKLVKKIKKRKILVIFDEVLTGFGRTGKMFATDHLDSNPDIICLAKGLTAGYIPLAATIFSEHIHKQFVNDDFSKTFLHGHSFTANPISCAAAIASMKIFDEEKTLEKVKLQESHHKEGLELLKLNSKVSHIRNIGGIAAFDIMGQKDEYGSKLGNKLRHIFLKKGLIIRPLGNTLYLMPPYCTKKEILENVYLEIDKELKKN